MHDYDADGEYVKMWCPELAKVPKEHVHHPWTWTGGPLDYPEQPILMRPEWAKFLGKSAKGNSHGSRNGGGCGGRGRGRGLGGKTNGSGGRGQRREQGGKAALVHDD
ncbi:hypothetical protein AURDEDRAFT_164713 [Auricularia subglabra TFB-10046 SS5]|nr:hypothetical protein AURDEDRAFT_164713 [Auricularia subglabra TFB-10046 SS5]